MKEIIIASFIVVLSVIILTRIVGLKSFAKITSFDFAITIAIGSMMASTILPKSVTLAQGCIAIALLYFIQLMASLLRKKSNFIQSLLDNKPMLVMKDGRFLHENIKKCHLTTEDIIGKLREANVLNLSKVKAVVFESTGDISVIHGEDNIDDIILADVSK